MSITGNYLFKRIAPNHVLISKNGIEFGTFKFYWNKRSMTESV